MALIAIDPRRVIGEVDRRIFGGFIENEGRAIDGGVFEPGSPFAGDDGIRRDTRDAIAGLNVPVLRWPGGNFVSAYHWTDAVGPVEQRPSRWDPAWGAVERNLFGTDEFMAYCADLDTEPYLCFNMGTGTLDEAMAWVEYCNGTADTHWANLRRANGRDEPYGVKYWGLGNEMWGDFQIGHTTAQEYAARAKQWALALKRVDPTIQLVACGKSGWEGWDTHVIPELVRYVDWYSIHIYTGSDDHWTNVLTVEQADRALRIAGTLIERARYEQGVEHPVHITYDEWNTWFATREDRRRDKIVEERHTLSDAVAVAAYLNVFVRNSKVLKMANIAQLVNVLAPIVTGPDGVLKQAIYHPLAIASAHTQAIALDVYVDSATVDHVDGHVDRGIRHNVADLGPFTVLDVAATRDEAGGRLVISVLNRDPANDITARVQLTASRFTGLITRRTVDGPDPFAVNDWNTPDVVTLVEDTVQAEGGWVELTFPACSVTQLDAGTEWADD